MLLYACTIFLSAFLLFQVQPLIAKMILPWFGGSAAVWTACMLFFQVLLLFGYLYADLTIRRLRSKWQSTLHVALLAVSLAALPVIPNPVWKPAGGEDPLLRILGLLAITIGLPYFLLSTTGPLVQAWFARDRMEPGATPYRLYALSNLGSMLALLTYPVAVEPYLPTRRQGQVWSVAYGCFVLLCGYTAFRRRNDALRAPSPGADSPGAAPPSGRLLLLWTLLPASASTLLLAVTNHLSENVAAVPFLWVLPLSLYLLSFILCFDGEGWYKRSWFLRLLAVMLGGMAYAMYTKTDMPLQLAVPLFCAGLFVCCMVCHGELVRLKPHPRYLTSFYLMTSAGGALGGIFVGLLAPHLFRSFYELPAGLAGCAVLILFVLHRDPTSAFYQAKWQPEWLITVSLTMALCGYIAYYVDTSLGDYRVAVRNFYGGLKVNDSGSGHAATRSLTHGTISHGEQFLDPGRRRQPTTYYGRKSGVGLALLAQAGDHKTMHVGVIGLGTGTLAAYGRPGDLYTYYEINPLVVRIANSEFTFLKDCPAKVEVVLGDARLSLEREPPQGFDVLAVDAFSSDSIPVHLLTEEAFHLYFGHLKPDGVLAVHVSNKYLDLKPVVKLAADALAKRTRLVDTDDDEEGDGTFGATWVLVTANQQFLDKPMIREASEPLKARQGIRIWTDNYSNLFRILK